MTKSAKIMELHARGLSTREIALEVYGEAIDKRMAYVRIVTRQRKNGVGCSEADKRWRRGVGREKYNSVRALWFSRRYHGDSEFRRKFLERAKARRMRVTEQVNHV